MLKVRVAPVLWWLSVTLAPETTAPVSSTTVPSIVPVVLCDCDQSGWERKSNINYQQSFQSILRVTHRRLLFSVEEYKGTLVKNPICESSLSLSVRPWC